jgi:alkylation response protein AidB-like acyl-CoA dehydrogenase
MDFTLTDEQIELQRVMRDLVERECPSSLVRAVYDGSSDGDSVWKALVSMDLTGASMVELVLVLEELGGAADPSPFLATTTQYLPLARACDEARAAAVAAGRVGAAVFAHDDITARRDGEGWVLDGVARHVLDADRADELAVVARAEGALGVFFVAPDAAQIERVESLDSALHFARVTFAATPVAAAYTDRARDVENASDEATTGWAAVMVGAAQHVFSLALGHIRQRHQFGVPIGSFQAVKHMAVDVYVAIERARAVTHYAAMAIAEDDAHRAVAASMAKAAAGDAQRIAVQHGIQLFGGLGYTWENDLHLYARRAKAGDASLGSAAEHRNRVARAVLANPTELSVAPTKRFDDATEAFRQEFVDWLAANIPPPDETTQRPRSTADIPPWARQWQAKMFDAGWLMPGYGPEFGGRNANLLQQFVHREELGNHRIYLSFNPQGVSIIAPSIISFGSEEQQRNWAVPLLRGEMTAALGMSEPDAGSDLAALRTRAVLDGDRFIVNGQKVWTSGAHHADFILAFVRTDPDAAKHRGISALIIPTDAPGVACRPFASAAGPDELDFNEVFFDDAIVPAANLVGELHEGWRVATGSLGHERAMLWLDYSERLDDLVVRGGQVLLDHGLADNALTLDWFAQLLIDLDALRTLGYRTLGGAQRGIETHEQSILKLLGSEAVQRGTLHVYEALGEDGLDVTPNHVIEPLNLDAWNVPWFELYLRSFGATIAGGTSQIQRNIIAERVLGLPR